MITIKALSYDNYSNSVWLSLLKLETQPQVTTILELAQLDRYDIKRKFGIYANIVLPIEIQKSRHNPAGNIVCSTDHFLPYGIKTYILPQYELGINFGCSGENLISLRITDLD